MTNVDPTLADLSGEAFEVAVVRAASLTCPRCRYDLAGATTLLCPECGCRAQIRLLSGDRVPSWHTTVLVGLCLVWPMTLALVPATFDASHSTAQRAGALALFAWWSVATAVWIAKRHTIVSRKGRAARVRVVLLWAIVLAAILLCLGLLIATQIAP